MCPSSVASRSRVAGLADELVVAGVSLVLDPVGWLMKAHSFD
jgi:hypothetical protein